MIDGEHLNHMNHVTQKLLLPASLIIAFLMIVFIIAISSAIFRGLDIECGCYGSATSADWTRIVEDFFLLAFSVYILFFPTSKFALENIIRIKFFNYKP